jgi:hypothetical protein
MLKNRARYEPFAWWLTRERIGQELKEQFQPPREMSPRLLALLDELNEKRGTSVRDNSSHKRIHKNERTL